MKKIDKFQRILHLPEDAKASLDFKTLKQSLIAENIFSYGLSESHFVLIVSNSQTYKVCLQFLLWTDLISSRA